MADGTSTNFGSYQSGGVTSSESYAYDDPTLMGMSLGLPPEMADSMNLSETTSDAGGFAEGGGESHLESSSEGVSFVESRQRMTGSARGHVRGRSTATAETESE